MTVAAFKQTKVALRNYIWGAKNGHTTHSKIKWDIITKPTVQGRVKIIDPTLQASALLTKILVRGLQLGYEPWKAYIRHKVVLTRMTSQPR
jgi:hypothetical protein